MKIKREEKRKSGTVIDIQKYRPVNVSHRRGAARLRTFDFGAFLRKVILLIQDSLILLIQDSLILCQIQGLSDCWWGKQHPYSGLRGQSMTEGIFNSLLCQRHVVCCNIFSQKTPPVSFEHHELQKPTSHDSNPGLTLVEIKIIGG